MINDADITCSGFRSDLQKKKVLTVQRADFTRKWLIAVLGLF